MTYADSKQKHYYKTHREKILNSTRTYLAKKYKETTNNLTRYGDHWTPDEIQNLIDLSKTCTISDAAMRLGRSLYSTRNKAQRLFIHFKHRGKSATTLRKRNELER